MNPNSKTSPFGFYLVAFAFLVAAAALWSARTQQAARQDLQNQLAQTNLSTPTQSQRETQQATALLYESFWADNHTKYSALAKTTASYGDKPAVSSARITRAPGALAIKFVSGPSQGLESGFSQRWFWRQSATGDMTPYAEVAHPATDMAAARFKLMLENYAVRLGQPTEVSGRPVSVVELSPWQPVEGAKGPAKRIYIDQETGLTLGVEAFNYQMKPVLHSTLSELDLTPQITETTFEAPANIAAAAKKENWRAEEMGKDFASVVQKTGVQPPRPTYTPPGFELDGYAVHRCNDIPITAALSRYTDGLNTLTVYAILDSPAAQKMAGSCGFGPGTMAARQAGDGHLVALGDLPPQTLERVLKSAKVEKSLKSQK